MIPWLVIRTMNSRQNILSSELSAVCLLSVLFKNVKSIFFLRSLYQTALRLSCPRRVGLRSSQRAGTRQHPAEESRVRPTQFTFPGTHLSTSHGSVTIKTR